MPNLLLNTHCRLVLGSVQTVALPHKIFQQTNYKVINKDQWTQFLEFSESVKSDFSNYDENAACMFAVLLART